MNLKHLLPLIDEDNHKLYWAFGLVAGSWTILLLISGVLWLIGNQVITPIRPPEAVKKSVPFRQFTSDSEFRNFLSRAPVNYYDSTIGGIAPRAMNDAKQAIPAELAAPSTYSKTNVQVAGIDEPDTIKTDGKNIYYALQNKLVYPTIRPVEAGILPVPPIRQSASETKVLDRQLNVLPSLELSGELLLTDSHVIALEDTQLISYNITDPKKPTKAWTYTYASRSQAITSRLVDKTLIIILATNVHANEPCPIPLLSGDKTITVPCTSIHYWESMPAAETTYTALKIDTADGSVISHLSWVADSAATTIYMSPENLYVGHYLLASESVLLPEFLTGQEGSSLLDETTRNQIQMVSQLAISDRAKQVEIEELLARYRAQFNDDQRLKWQTDFQNAYITYKQTHAREIEQTVLTRIDTDSFAIQATGSIPGKLLNQFSMDEYNGHLRLATTIGDRWEARRNSVSEVIVLDSDLKSTGQVTDLGKEERIYGVRFLQDRGYVITFRETDPLYVLDLRNPAAPILTGELKIPGYSSYLHPLSDSLILGVGREDNQVKLALYNVSDMNQPQEVAKYLLDEYWSDAVTNHHAFLHNPDAATFFIPGNKGAYFFTWQPDSLKLVHTLADPQAKRAVYIDSTWYVAGDTGITSVDGVNWKRTHTLTW